MSRYSYHSRSDQPIARIFVDVTLPPEDLYVTHCEQSGSTLKLRFVGDLYPDAQAPEEALEIILEQLEDAPACVEFFRPLMRDEPVYLEARGNKLVVTAGTGAVLSMNPASLTIARVELNRDEMRQHMKLVQEWYLAAHHNLTKATGRMKAARDLIEESLRRTQLKSAGHGTGGTAAVLYEQQLHLLRRLLRTLDG